jgi:hypothetical protein
MSIDFETLRRLSDGGEVTDTACPLCGPQCRRASNRYRKVLRIWSNQNGSFGYCCQRCGEGGSAYERRSYAHKTPYERALEMANDLKASPSVVAFRQPEPDADKLLMLRRLWRRSVPARGTIVETYLCTRKCWVDTEMVRYLPARAGHCPALIVPFGTKEDDARSVCRPTDCIGTGK